MKWSREHVLPQKCLFGVLTRIIMRTQFAALSSHGAGSGLCSARLQQTAAMKLKDVCSLEEKL